jgi:DNA-directed RNA polymerase III subunit RPC6
MKMKTGLTQTQITNILKVLEARQLVKPVVSTQVRSLKPTSTQRPLTYRKGASKKIYIDFNVEPASEVTGGAWYTNGETDKAFIDGIAQSCVAFFQKKVFPPFL